MTLRKSGYLRNRALVAALVVICLLLTVAVGSAADLVSTFDAGLDGWTGAHGTIAHAAAGGNPGGYLVQTDADDDFMQVFAPPAYLGNLSAYLGGTLSFDALNVNNEEPNSPDLPQFGTVIITGSAGIASLALGGVGNPLADGNWHSFSGPMNSGEPLLAAVLADVTQIQVILESHIGVSEAVGFDNFRMVAVPEPAALTLTILGGAALLFAARRRRSGDAR